MSNPVTRDNPRQRRIYSTAHGELVFGDRCLVLGILNVTPDSFSDAGAHLDADAAIRRAIEMVREGADTIDIGGESTRPGSRPVPAGEQIDRVAPVIRGARAAGVTVPISIDTRSAEVAGAALDAGADIVNDISAVRHLPWSGECETSRQDKAKQGECEEAKAEPRDEPKAGGPCIDNLEMMQLLARRGVPFIIMHMQGTPETMQKTPTYNDVVRDVSEFFEERAAALAAAGVPIEGRLIVDPGIGFGKTLDHNLALISACPAYSHKWPVLLGTSRKRFLADILSQIPGRADPPDTNDRLMGTAATVAYAALNNIDMVRVHDVRAMREVVEVCRRLSP